MARFRRSASASTRSFFRAICWRAAASGTRGGELATEYIATQLALAGAKPAGDHGTYFQKVPLVGIETQPGATLAAAAGGKSAGLPLAATISWARTPAAAAGRRASKAKRSSWATASRAPEWKWDDFKGVDVTGKVLVLFTNEPPSDDPKFFDGRALTYYGRWTYKYEEALRAGRGARIIIHTTPTASYGWDVVRNSWGRETPFVKLAPGEKALAFAGWITREAGEKLLALAGKTVDELLAAAREAAISSRSTWASRCAADLPSKIREIWRRATWPPWFRAATRN